MRITLFYNKSVHENAAYYYQLAKEAREKVHGAEKAIKETEKEISQANSKKSDTKSVRLKRTKEWYEKFHFSHTSGGLLMIGGRNAQQNDMVVSKYMEDNDLFFHADIQGGAVVVLKGGKDSDESELLEAAQFAASFSKAWQNGNASVDVYAVTKEKLTKNVSGGFVPSGAFAILGERKWFRSTPLSLRIGKDENMKVIPQCSKIHIPQEISLIPALSGKDKGAIAKSLAKRFTVHPDDLLELLPNGKTKTVIPL